MANENTTHPIYSPRYEGSRFEEHRLPLELVDDLLTLRNMTVEMAKALYLRDNEGRQRVPKNFTNGISIELAGIAPGSTIPQLLLVAALQAGSPANTGYVDYFMRATEHILHAIEIAHGNQNPQGTLPDHVLNHFNRLGRNLREDERIVFGDTPAVLDRDSRKRLVLAASKAQEYKAVFELRGIVTAMDKAQKTFEIQTAAGAKVKGNYPPEYLDVLQEAFVNMEAGKKVLLKGTGVFNAEDKLMSIETVEEAAELEPLDVPARLEELALLPQGWLDGEAGAPLDPAGIKWLGGVFEQSYDSDTLPLPATFPTPDGNIQFEWSLNGQEIALTVDLATRQGAYYALHTQTQAEIAEDLNLTSSDAWQHLNHLIAHT